MNPEVKTFIEKYVDHLDDIKMTLYLAYREGLNNFEVYLLREILDHSGICNLNDSQSIAEELFLEAFQSYMKLNREITIIPSFNDFLFGSPTSKKALTNIFGLSFNDTIDVIERNANSIGITVENDPVFSDIKIVYHRR